jgi:hypothetical protein
MILGMSDASAQSGPVRAELPVHYLPQAYPLWIAYVDPKRMTEAPTVDRVIGWEVHHGLFFPMCADLTISVNTEKYYVFGYGEEPQAALDRLAKVVRQQLDEIASEGRQKRG